MYRASRYVSCVFWHSRFTLQMANTSVIKKHDIEQDRGPEGDSTRHVVCGSERASFQVEAMCKKTSQFQTLYDKSRRWPQVAYNACHLKCWAQDWACRLDIKAHTNSTRRVDIPSKLPSTQPFDPTPSPTRHLDSRVAHHARELAGHGRGSLIRHLASRVLDRHCQSCGLEAAVSVVTIDIHAACVVAVRIASLPHASCHMRL